MGRISINNKIIEVTNGSISIINNKVFANGKEIDINDMDSSKTINVFIEGNVKRVECNGSVKIKGNVYEDIDCGGSVSITGNIEGDVDCGGSVQIIGEHKGSIDAGGSVSIG